MKNKLKAEKERSEDLEDENSKMKKKLRDARTEVEEEMAAKDEVNILKFKWCCATSNL